MPYLILGSASKTDTMSEEVVKRLIRLEGLISRPTNRSLTGTILQEPRVSIFTVSWIRVIQSSVPVAVVPCLFIDAVSYHEVRKNMCSIKDID